jgi:hypothetical protein
MFVISEFWNENMKRWTRIYGYWSWNHASLNSICSLPTYFLPEEARSTFLRIGGKYLPDHTASHPLKIVVFKVIPMNTSSLAYLLSYVLLQCFKKLIDYHNWRFLVVFLSLSIQLECRVRLRLSEAELKSCGIIQITQNFGADIYTTWFTTVLSN